MYTQTRQLDFPAYISHPIKVIHMSNKPTHTQKLLEAIIEQNPGISLSEAWRIYRQKYEVKQ